jgi:hypothetical protein
VLASGFVDGSAALAVDPGDRHAETRDDALLAVPGGAPERQRIEAAAAHDPAQVDAVVGGSRLLAKNQKAKTCGETPTERLLAEVLTHHAVANDDQRGQSQRLQPVPRVPRGGLGTVRRRGRVQ